MHIIHTEEELRFLVFGRTGVFVGYATSVNYVILHRNFSVLHLSVLPTSIRGGDKSRPYKQNWRRRITSCFNPKTY